MCATDFPENPEKGILVDAYVLPLESMDRHNVGILARIFWYAYRSIIIWIIGVWIIAWTTMSTRMTTFLFCCCVCHFAAFLSFSSVPFFLATDSGIVLRLCLIDAADGRGDDVIPCDVNGSSGCACRNVVEPPKSLRID